MKPANITYYRHNKFDLVYCIDSAESYPTHTHAAHMTLGYVVDGAVRLVCSGRERLYRAGGFFCIMPDIPHAVEPVEGRAYSMASVCIAADRMPQDPESTAGCVIRLKQIISDAPQKPFPIQAMAERIALSPYHMIRQFKASCGLTPHQFQIQCRVRKAQRLLEEGKSVTEAAYAAGFCDQSHFDRCFHKIVRLTPKEYKASARLFG